MLKDNMDDNDKHDPRPSDSETENDDNKEFGRNMIKWSDLLPIAVWKRIFKKWNPKIFTKANINAMFLRGQRETALKSVHLLAEAMTDITMDETIVISKRTKRKCIDHQVAHYTASGDRAQYIEMPPTSPNAAHTSSKRLNKKSLQPATVGKNNKTNHDPKRIETI